MKIINHCWSCNKEYDLSEVHFIDGIRDLKCDCGGFVITPSGKANFKIVKDN
jgi:hypothetical protein